MRRSWGFVLWVEVSDDLLVEDVIVKYDVFEVFLVFDVKVCLFLKLDRMVIDFLLVVDLKVIRIDFVEKKLFDIEVFVLVWVGECRL